MAIDKKYKAFIIIFAVLIFIPTAMYIILLSNRVQTYLTNQITQYLSKEYGVEMRINKVSFSFFDALILEDVYIEDRQFDTLCYIKKLKTDINSTGFLQRKIIIEKVTAEKTRLNVYEVDTSARLNMDFLIEAFSQEDTTAKEPGKWQILFDELELENSDISYRTFMPDTVEYGVNFDDLYLRSTHLHLNDIKIEDSITFEVKDLSFTEKSGWIVSHFYSRANMNEFGIFTDSVVIQMPQSHIKAKRIDFLFDEYKDFSAFFDKIKLDIAIHDSSVIATNDLAYIVPEAKELNQEVLLSGRFFGKLNNFKGREVGIEYGTRSGLYADFNITGLPDIEQSLIYIDVESMALYAGDFSTLADIPASLNQIGTVNFRGNFTGFINDFVTYGTFSSQWGTIKTDIQLKPDEVSPERVTFSGKLSTKNLNLGKLSGEEELLGTTTMDADIKGATGIDNRIQANINANIRHIELNRYKWKDIEVKGEITEDKFDGSVFARDTNFTMEFSGKFDFSQQVPAFNFLTIIDNANLYKLNIDKSDSTSQLALALKADFTGANLDQLQGKIHFDELRYQREEGIIKADKLHLSVKEGKDSTKHVNVTSDFADLNISGIFKFQSLSRSLGNLLTVYLPAFSEVEDKVIPIAETKKNPDDSLNFSLKFKKTKQLSKVFFPSVFIHPRTQILGNYKTNRKDLNISLISPEIAVGSYQINDFAINVDALDSIFRVGITSEKFNFSDDRFIENVKIKSQAHNDSLHLFVNWDNHKQQENFSGDISTILTFSKPEKRAIPHINMSIDSSAIIVADSVWNMKNTVVNIDSTFIDIKKLWVKSGNQHIYINGTISENPNDSLRISLQNFNLHHLNLLVENDSLFQGVLNGTTIISSPFNNPFIYSNDSITDFYIDKEPFGNLYLTSNWNAKEECINLVGYTRRGNIRTLDIKGDYYPKNKTLDFDTIAIEKLRLNILEPFVEGILSDVVGRVNGNFSVKGTTDAPKFYGTLRLVKAGFTIDYLQTRYTTTTNENAIEISNNFIKINDIKLNPPYHGGDSAIISAYIKHNNFDDMDLDIKIDARNFMFLNTTERDNDMFYGKAYLTGVTNISGDLENINIDISAQTEKRTQFFIPLNTTEEVSEANNFITFISQDTMNIREPEEYEVDLSGIDMNFDLQITKDAEVRIIFDEKVGDMIKARGHGDLTIKISTLGDFNMYGDYVINNGDYLFTLQNIINKHFNVEKGGTIRWNGDPTNATIDLTAIYAIKKASLYDLMLEERYKDIKVPVECHLKLENKLMNPDITFDLEMPEEHIDQRIVSTVENLPVDATNKQILSLLVMQRFQPLPGLSSSIETPSSDAVSANAYELLSNQLSHWLSQISNEFDLGVKYQPGTELTSDQVEIMFSTQIINDRVSINVNSNVGVGEEEINTAEIEGQKSSNNIVGDVNVEYKITENGKLRVKYFARTNDELIEEAPYTQGVGLFYREDFDSLKKLIQRYKNKLKKDD